MTSRHAGFALLLGVALVASAAGCSRPAEGFAGDDDDAVEGARQVFTVEGFSSPESVRYDAEQDAFFVSNMVGYGSAKDGAGYIVRFPADRPSDATVLVQSGRNGATLHAPKGMALHGDTLWVADIDALRGFDRRTGAPLATIDLAAHRPSLLNDVAIGADGRIHTTDSGIIMSDVGVIYVGGDRVFAVGPGRTVEVIASGPRLGRPNGITWDAPRQRWLVASFDPFDSRVFVLRPGDTTLTRLASGRGRWDGVEALADGRVVVSSWSDSSLHLVDGEEHRRIVRHLIQPADIGIDTRRNRVAVPLALQSRVEVWTLPPR